jgi:DNA-binding MarR family transcriptional regulator
MVRVLRSSSRAVERHSGISGAQLFVLRQLAAVPGQSLNELAARTLTHQSTVSEVVGRLVARRLVSRRSARDDARRLTLSLTVRGRTLLHRAPRAIQAVLVDGFGRLPIRQQRALADGLEAWLAAAGLAEVPPTMFFEPVRRSRASR